MVSQSWEELDGPNLYTASSERGSETPPQRDAGLRRERGREGESEKGRKGRREGGREGGREAGSEGGRK